MTKPLISSTLALLITVGLAWAGFCADTITDGDISLRLLGEQLVVEVEETGNGERYGHMVVGYYRANNGKTIRIDCSGQTSNYVVLGESA